MEPKQRVLCWFSCGAASAAAAKLAIDTLGADHEVVVVNCDTRPSEHSDNYRFSQECEKWFGRPITYIRNPHYATVDDVFEKTRYMAGIRGARCTTELKKLPRFEFALPDDIHIFGFTVEETRRINAFEQRNPDLRLRFILRDLSITKAQCLQMVTDAGIEHPAMYQLGFDNNNCPGCVKATGAWYWSKIREHFPDVFARRALQSRDIGCRLVRIDGKRIFLDELPYRNFRKPRRKENLSCGPECGLQEPEKQKTLMTATKHRRYKTPDEVKARIDKVKDTAIKCLQEAEKMEETVRLLQRPSEAIAQDIHSMSEKAKALRHKAHLLINNRIPALSQKLATIATPLLPGMPGDESVPQRASAQ